MISVCSPRVGLVGCVCGWAAYGYGHSDWCSGRHGYCAVTGNVTARRGAEPVWSDSSYGLSLRTIYAAQVCICMLSSCTVYNLFHSCASVCFLAVLCTRGTTFFIFFTSMLLVWWQKDIQYVKSNINNLNLLIVLQHIDNDYTASVV